MSQVTNEIAQLRAQLRQLVQWRQEMVKGYHAQIKETNAMFDAQCKEINRQIGELEELLPKPEPLPEVETVKASRSGRRERATLTVEDGFTPEEIEHYNRLKGRR